MSLSRLPFHRPCGLVAAIAGVVLASGASAAIIPIGEFTGERSEGYETQARFQFLPSYDVFDGTAVVRQVSSGQGLHITTGWAFFSTVFPHSGEAFMGGAGVNYEYVFDTPAQRFGGFFATNADLAGAMVSFFDEDDNLLDMLAAEAPMGNNWAWNGWESDGAGIARVQVIANNRFGGFIMNDDMQYSTIPVPGVLALLGLGGLARRRRRA